MKLVMLTKLDGDKVLVNLDNVSKIELWKHTTEETERDEDGNDPSWIFLNGGSDIIVRETLADFYAQHGYRLR